MPTGADADGSLEALEAAPDRLLRSGAEGAAPDGKRVADRGAEPDGAHTCLELGFSFRLGEPLRQVPRGAAWHDLVLC